MGTVLTNTRHDQVFVPLCCADKLVLHTSMIWIIDNHQDSSQLSTVVPYYHAAGCCSSYFLPGFTLFFFPMKKFAVYRLLS